LSHLWDAPENGHHRLLLQLLWSPHNPVGTLSFGHLEETVVYIGGGAVTVIVIIVVLLLLHVI
jgi:hypothetical protein